MICRCCFACALCLTTLVRPADVPALAAAPLPEPAPIYHADASHLWNRLHAALLMRIGPDGRTYGQDRLEPLLWHQSDYLASGPAADRLAVVLKEFLDTGGEKLIADPLKRAILQRDLWRIARWMARHPDDPALLLGAVARAMSRLALSPQQIAALPDNYAAAVASGQFATRFDDPRLDVIRSRNERPTVGYLPADLLREDGPWVCIGRTDGPTAPQHVAGDLSNAAFLVLLKLPAGRDAGLAFVRDLAAMKRPLLLPPPIDPATGRRTGDQSFNPDAPALPKGSELALVRMAMLIDDGGRVVASRLVESVQVRVIGSDPADAPGSLVFPTNSREVDLRRMAVFETQQKRVRLFAGQAGGFIDVSDTPDFKTGFATHGTEQFVSGTPGEPGDEFPRRQQSFFGQYACVACHRSPTIYGTMSFQTFVPWDEERGPDSPSLFPVKAMSVDEVCRSATRWVEDQKSFRLVRKSMD